MFGNDQLIKNTNNMIASRLSVTSSDSFDSSVRESDVMEVLSASDKSPSSASPASKKGKNAVPALRRVVID